MLLGHAISALFHEHQIHPIVFCCKEEPEIHITGFIYQSHMGLTIFGYICKAFTKKNPEASQISRIGGQSG